MSSDSSVSLSTLSKIRQFGLYRTVDARTEEFLRLSKKKQIKQGCACAAISTAITVTVVVVTLLIYEYLNGTYTKTESRMNGKEYWQNLMNNSFKIKQNERNDLNRFGLDKALNMLPMLLKALKSTKLIDKLVTDPSITTDHNMYETDMRRGIEENNKDTILKLNTLDFKTLPILLFPKTKKNNHFKHNAKERSIKHQRHLDYFYKMIHGRFDHYRPVTKAGIENIAENEENTSNVAKQLEKNANEIKVEHSPQTCRCSNFFESLLNNVSYHLNKVISVVQESKLKAIKEEAVIDIPYITNYEREKTSTVENIIPISNKQLYNDRSLFKVNFLNNNNSKGNYILNRNFIINNEKEKLWNLGATFLNETLKAYVIPMPLYPATTNKLNLSQKYTITKNRLPKDNKTIINNEENMYDFDKKNKNQTLKNLETKTFNYLNSNNKLKAKLVEQRKITAKLDFLQESHVNEDNKNGNKKEFYISGKNIFISSTEYPAFTVPGVNTYFNRLSEEQKREPSGIFRKLTQEHDKNLTKDSNTLIEVDPTSYQTNETTVTTIDYDYDYYQNNFEEPNVEMFNDNLTLSFNNSIRIPSKIQNKLKLLKSVPTITEYSLQWTNNDISNEDYLYEEQRKAAVDILNMLTNKKNKEIEMKPFPLHGTEDRLRPNINKGPNYRSLVFTTAEETVDATATSTDNVIQKQNSTQLHYDHHQDKSFNYGSHILKQVHKNNLKEETPKVQILDDILPVKYGKHKHKESISTTDYLLQQENDLLSRYDYLYDGHRKNEVDMLTKHTTENYDTDKVNVPIHLHKLGEFLYPILLESQKYYTTNNISTQNQIKKSHNFRYSNEEIKYENTQTEPKHQSATLHKSHQVLIPKTTGKKNKFISTTEYTPFFKNIANYKNVDEKKRKVAMSTLDKVIYGYYKPFINTPDELQELNSLLQPILLNTTKSEEIIKLSSTSKAAHDDYMYPINKLYNNNNETNEKVSANNDEDKQRAAIKSSLKLNNNVTSNFNYVSEDEAKATMELINDLSHEKSNYVLSEPNSINMQILQNDNTKTYSSNEYLNDELTKLDYFQNNQTNTSANILNIIINEKESFDVNYPNILRSHNIQHLKEIDKEKSISANKALQQQENIIPYYDFLDKGTTFNKVNNKKNKHLEKVSTLTKDINHRNDFTTIKKSEENLKKIRDSDYFYDDNKTSAMFNNNAFNYEVDKALDNEPLQSLKLNHIIPLHEVDTKSYSMNISDYGYLEEQKPHNLVSSKNKTKHLPNKFKSQPKEKYEVTELSHPTTSQNKPYFMSNSFVDSKTDNILTYDDVYKEEKETDIGAINISNNNIQENTDKLIKVLTISNDDTGLKSNLESTTLNYDYFQDDKFKTTLLTTLEQEKYIAPITKTDLVYSEINDIYSDNTPSSEEKYRHVNEDTKRILTTVLYKRPSYLNIQRSELW